MKEDLQSNPVSYDFHSFANLQQGFTLSRRQHLVPMHEEWDVLSAGIVKEMQGSCHVLY